MKKVILFIAMSLDGYIADEKGNVDWLVGEDAKIENEDTYSEFIKNIDTVIMGWNTYHQIVTELSPSQWVYQNLTSYVLTHRKRPSTENINFVQESPLELINCLKKQDGKNIWLCGGANLIQQCLKEDLIDQFHLSVIPTILGKGIHLFGTQGKEYKLKLISSRNYNGITEVIYDRKDTP